jgi:protein TonB
MTRERARSPKGAIGDCPPAAARVALAHDAAHGVGRDSMENRRDLDARGWRRAGTAFALSLAVHGGLVAAALWLLGTPGAAPRAERPIDVVLSPAPAAPSQPAEPGAAVNPIPAKAPTVAAAGAPVPAAQAAAPPAAVLVAAQDAEAEAARRLREALAAHDRTAIAPPVHSQTAASTPAIAGSTAPGAAAPGADASTQRGFVELHVLDWLAQHRSYPRAARRAGIEGTVQVRFVLDAEGRIADAAVERSSGATVLDRAALALLDRASPVPGIAQFGLTGAMELRLPVDYRLRPRPRGA